jgi:hypothetical protein
MRVIAVDLGGTTYWLESVPSEQCLAFHKVVLVLWHYAGSGGEDPYILNSVLAASEWLASRFCSLPLKHLHSRLFELQGRYGRSGEERGPDPGGKRTLTIQ